MTIKEMNCDLENRGFQTSVQYVKSVHKYKFTLTRNNFTRTYWFEYPNVENPYSHHVITLDWLRDTVRDFECHEAMYEIQLRPTILQGDIIHGYSYSTSRNERKDYMKTPEIKNVIFNDPATIAQSRFVIYLRLLSTKRFPPQQSHPTSALLFHLLHADKLQ